MRQIISFLLILTAITANCRKISPEEAQVIASEFFNMNSSSSNTPPRRALRANNTKGKNSQNPFYIFNADDNAGFIIISRDTRAPKIIGYGTRSVDVNNLPPQLQTFLMKQDSVLNSNSALPEHKSWGQNTLCLSTNTQKSKLLETADWGQGYPFNSKTPIIDGTNCPTGCGPTALAILMKYHNWPQTGRGSNNHIDPITGTEMSNNFSELEFNWDKLPNHYTEGEYNNSQAEKIAEIMNAIGCAMNARYSLDGTGTWNHSPNYVLYKYFKYKIPYGAYVNSEMSEHASFNSEQLASKFIDEINNNRPILMSAVSNEGHVFIIDGYNENGDFHINWGWDGIGNGYYPIDNFNGYNYLQNFSTYITPDLEATEEYAKLMITDGSITHQAEKVSNTFQLSSNDMQSNTEYYTMTGKFTATSDLKATLAVALTDKDNNVKEICNQFIYDFKNPDMDTTSLARLWNLSSLFKPVSFTNIEPTDKIQLVYKTQESNEWKIVLSPDFAPANVPVTGNTPPFVNVKWNVDDEVKHIITSNIDYKNHSTVNGLIGSYISINITNVEGGIPVILVNGENMTYTIDNKSFSTYFTLRDETTIDIAFINDSELIDLDLNIEEPGNLSNKISFDKALHIRRLKLSGEINKQDIDYLNKAFLVLQSLDLSQVQIFPQNYIPKETNFTTRTIKQIILPSDLKGFEDYCFMESFGGCHILDIPESVEEIGRDAFLNFYLEKVIVHCEKPIKLVASQTDDYPRFFNSAKNNGNATLYVPRGSKNTYEETPGWMDFPNIVEYEDEWSEVTSPIKDNHKTITIFNVHGNKVYEGEEKEYYNLDKGIYIFVDGNKTMKVLK